MTNDKIQYFNSKNLVQNPSNFSDTAGINYLHTNQESFEHNKQSSISGTYEGKMTAPDTGAFSCEIRIDVDQRYPNAPIMNRVSGDFFRLTRNLASIISPLTGKTGIQKPDISPTSKTYLESWIVDSPNVKWSETIVEISGIVKYWNNGHPQTQILITIQRGTLANVIFTETGGYTLRYTCDRTSDCFRNLNLEIDVTKSVMTKHPEPILPSYDTHSPNDRPFDIPRRILTIEESYRETGVCVSINSQHDIIDDTAENLHALHDAELHEIMTYYYSAYKGIWPNWNMWGLLCGSYEDLDRPEAGQYVLGIMFDAQLQDDRREERQGFAIFRNHFAFDNLVPGVPTNQKQAESMRDFLYSFVHEAGHAFNFVHSWNKQPSRPTSLSFMNYPQEADKILGEGYFWKNFYFRFDDDELIHLRHGNRPAVIMGGDAWGSDRHLESPAAALFQVEKGEPLVELLIRSEPYYEFMEPVTIELRIRNLLHIPINVKSILNPAYGNTSIYIQTPNGNVRPYLPVIVKESFPVYRTLEALKENSSESSGLDRYSEVVNLTYGKFGFYFKEPGEYKIRAIYTGAENTIIPSNTSILRVGHNESYEKKYAKDYFSDQVGMNLYLHGSMSSSLSKGREFLNNFAQENKHSVLGAKVGTMLGKCEMRPFFSLENKKLKQVHSPNYKKALDLTEPAYDVYKKEKSKGLNILFHRLVDVRSNALLKIGKKDMAKKELSDLYKMLSSREVKKSVLSQIKTEIERIEKNQKK